MSISLESGGSDISLPEEEDEEKYNLGIYIGERNSTGERHGRGWAILPNGDQYDGQYRHGKRHGIGLYVFKEGSRYYGRYRCGHRSGRGLFIYPDGSVYEGNWQKNIKHGKGRYVYANGDTYAGDWYHGIRHGVGIYTFKNESNCALVIRFKGTWYCGQRVGHCEVYFVSGPENIVVLHGCWDKNFPQGPTVFNFEQRYMLMGFFQTQLTEPNVHYNIGEEGESLTEDKINGDIPDANGITPSAWFAQDISVYNFSQLPQEPVPLPLSDSDISICSLSTVHDEPIMEPTIVLMGEGEGEEEGEDELDCLPCECCTTEIETDSESPCTTNPCAIEIISQPIC